MRRFLRAPELEDVHSVMYSEHNSGAFSCVVGRAARAAVGSLSSKSERMSCISDKSKCLSKRGLVQRTEYFGGRNDILSDDSYAVEAVRK
jgi:hypothetical protein